MKFETVQIDFLGIMFQGSYKKLQPLFKDFSRTFQGPH